MVEAIAGSGFGAVLANAELDQVGIIGVQVINLSGDVVVERTTENIVELGEGYYLAQITAPVLVGNYVIRWDDGGDPPVYANESLEVEAIPLGVGDYEALPSADEIALLLRTRTAGGVEMGLGGDTNYTDQTTFDETTRPSISEVEAVILEAARGVGGTINADIPDSIPENMNGAVRHAVALYAAILIELSFFRETANDDFLTLLRDLYNDQLGQLRKNIDTALGTKASFGTIRVGTTLGP